MHVLGEIMQNGMQTGIVCRICRCFRQATRMFVSSVVVFYLAMFCAAVHLSSLESLVILLV